MNLNCLGYEAGTDPAFCGIISTLVENNTRVDADYPILAGYEIWNYLAFVVLPVLFIIIIVEDRKNKRLEKEKDLQIIDCQECNSVTTINSSERSGSNSSSGSSGYSGMVITLSKMADGKVVLVPIVYLLSKFIGLAADVGIYFLPTHARLTYRMNAFSSVLVFIAVSPISLHYTRV